MSNIKKTPIECEFFIETDPYNFITDNRPLQNLLNNDLLMNADLEAVVTEVTDARTGLLSTYATLDNRLDDMEGSIGASVSVSEMEDIQGHQYGDFISNSEAIRRTTPSGFLDHGGIADLATGTEFDDFAGIRTTTQLGVGFQNSIVLWTGWGTTYRPIRAAVNGWIVRLFDEKAGTPGSVASNHVTIDLSTAPLTSYDSTFVFLEVWLQQIDRTAPTFVRNGAVNANDASTVSDHLHPDVIHTVKAMAPGGDWIQLRHRIRVVTGTSAAQVGYAFFSTAAKAQGGQVSPNASYSFSNMESQLNDSGLWRSGAGDSTSKTDLGSYDGYVWAIPITSVHRRNSGDYSTTNQAGSRKPGVGTSGYLASGVSGRPDGLYYDSIDQRDILDLRHRISLSGFNLRDELTRSWQQLIRGEMRTNWRELEYDWNNDNTWEHAGSWGHTLTPIDQISNTAEQWTNPLRDRAVTGSPLAAPDGQRTAWGRTAHIQNVKFSFTQGNAGTASPAGFVTYNPGTETLTFNAASLSGAGTGGTKVGMQAPVIMKKSDLTSKPTTVVSTGLGTQTATSSMTGLAAATQYVGFVQVIYPGGTGLLYPHKKMLSHTVFDGGVTEYPSEQFGVTGVVAADNTHLNSPVGLARMSTGHYVVADSWNHRVVKIDPTTWSIVAQFGVTGITAADNTHLYAPVGVAVDSSNNVYVCDQFNNRVVKLNSSLSYVAQFGATGLPGSDNAHVINPRYITTDSTNVWFSDSLNHRVVKLTTAMSYVSQFGTTLVPGAGTSGLNAPQGVAVVTAGFGTGLWMADAGNRRIVVTDLSFTYKYQIADAQDTQSLVIDSITDVAIDPSGNYYISVAKQNTVFKYNSALSLIGRFGNGVAGGTDTQLSGQSGIAYDPNNNWLYIADSQNHRLLKVNPSTMTKIAQFGITGYYQYYPANQLAAYIGDVAVDGLGNVYFTQNLRHCVTKLDSSLNFLARFGIYGTAVDATSNPTAFLTGLQNPVGIGVNTAGTEVAVADTNNNRIVLLSGSLSTPATRAWVPQYHTSTQPLKITRIHDIEWSASDSVWVAAVREEPLTAVATQPSQWTHALLTFSSNPGSTPGTQNWTRRFQCASYVTGCAITATQFIAGTEKHGLQVFTDKTNPALYFTTVDPKKTIYFVFYDLMGLSSDGSHVLVSDRNAHAVYAFESDAGVYLGLAGVMFESGDDNCHLQYPYQAIKHGKYLVVADTTNRRLLRRHISSPWVSDDSTITTMLAPVGADKIRVFYETESYQGILAPAFATDGFSEAVYKSQVIVESDKIYASTLGLGGSLTAQIQNFFFLKGMTSRLPLPTGWNDFDVKPVGMKIGTGDADDDGPYLVLPVTTTEGLMGGQVNITQEGGSLLSSKQALQQVIRTVGGPDNPISRGLRSVLPTEQVTPRSRTIKTIVTSGTSSITAPNVISRSGQAAEKILVEQYFETIRRGTPNIGSYNLLEAVPHFVYYPYFYQRNGRVAMGVVAVAENGKKIAIGNYTANAVDTYWPMGKILVRA